MAKAVPANATKQSHPQIRELYKTCCLGIQYSMQAIGLAHRLGKSEAEAQVLLNHHQEQFPDFWRWVERVVTHMEFKRYLCTKSGWRVVRRDKQFPGRWRRSAQNWLIQSTGADVLRLCCCLITEAGISLCCPVHDAILIEDSADRIEQTAKKARELMAEASRTLLDGFEIKTEAVIFRDRFVDKRGVGMWNKITRLMASCDGDPQDSLFDFQAYRVQHAQGVQDSAG
jgi:DNA polymerase I-like protein with 3'-5' exonuclease and polymerase domains